MSIFPSTEATCMLPVKNMERARQFYGESLGLQPVGGKPDGKFVYRCGGTEIALFPKPEGTKAQHTALSFRVDNITNAIGLLKSRGVTENETVPLSPAPREAREGVVCWLQTISSVADRKYPPSGWTNVLS